MKSNEDNKTNFQYFATKQFFMFKTSLLLLNFCLYVYNWDKNVRGKVMLLYDTYLHRNFTSKQKNSFVFVHLINPEMFTPFATRDKVGENIKIFQVCRDITIILI